MAKEPEDEAEFEEFKAEQGEEEDESDGEGDEEQEQEKWSLMSYCHGSCDQPRFNDERGWTDSPA